jgi:hypothetical protein
MGADYVLNTSDADFDPSLHELCRRLGATLGFDAVAGEMSARVLRAQPRGSRLRRTWHSVINFSCCSAGTKTVVCDCDLATDSFGSGSPEFGPIGAMPFAL